MKVTGCIPIKAYLLKYIRWRENLPENKPLIIPGDNVIAMYLDTILTNKTAIRDDKRHTMQSYDAKLPILFTETAIKWNQLFFTSTRVQSFNNFVYRLMISDLVNRILIGKQLKQQEKVTIAKFQMETDMFEISFDGLKKASTRYRKRKKKAMFHPRNCRSVAQ